MRILVKVKANSKQELIQQAGKDSFLVCVKAKPAEGKANLAVIKALACYFDVPQSSVSLLKGRSSKQKVFEINT